MKIEDTPTGQKITLDKRWHALWFIACCWWYRVPMTIHWEPKRRETEPVQPDKSTWLCDYHPTEICGQCGNGCGPGSRKA